MRIIFYQTTLCLTGLCCVELAVFPHNLICFPFTCEKKKYQLVEVGVITLAFHSYLRYLPTQEKLDLVHCLFGRHCIRERLPLRKNPVSHNSLTLDPIVKFVTFPTSLAFSGTSGGGHVFAGEK